MRTALRNTLGILLALMVSLSVQAEEAAAEPEETQEQESESGTPTAEEIAAQLSNPNTSLASLFFNLDYVEYKGSLPGADGAEAWRLSFQPSFPYPLGDGKNFF